MRGFLSDLVGLVCTVICFLLLPLVLVSLPFYLLCIITAEVAMLRFGRTVPQDCSPASVWLEAHLP